MFAATNGSADAVGFLLDRGADARVRSKRNETALGNAGTAGVEATVRLLLDHGAEVNVRNIRGYSPLMLAASSDAVPSGAVKLLLAKGADTTYTADYDESARDLASKRGDTAVVRLLGGMPSKTTHAATINCERRRASRRGRDRPRTARDKQTSSALPGTVPFPGSGVGREWRRAMLKVPAEIPSCLSP
jgi:hypothetical protein